MASCGFGRRNGKHGGGWSRSLSLGTALLVGVLAVTALSGCKDRKEAANAELSGERLAPELVATTQAGDVVRLEDLRGKVVLVNFWLAECGPCLAEMPDFDRFYQAHRHQGLEVVAINMGQSEDAVRRATRRMDVTFPLLADPLKITTTRYNVLAAPTSFVVDAEGRLVKRINGPLNHHDLAEILGPLLSDEQPEPRPDQGDENAST